MEPVSGTLDDLVLVRLLSTGKAGGPVLELERDLLPLFEQRLARAEFGEELEARLALLAEEKLVELGARKARLLAPGTRRATTFLGASKIRLPVRWPVLRDSYLVALALGLPSSPKTRERIAKADGLRAEIIRQAHDLSLEAAPTLAQVRRALAWQLLERGASHEVIDRVGPKGFAAGTALGVLIYSELGAAGRPDSVKGIRLLAARALGTGPDTKSLRLALLRRLADGERPGIAHPAASEAEAATLPVEALDTRRFAESALSSARRSSTGRFGDSLVFISHAYRQFLVDNPDERTSIGDFKERLVEANREGLLSLSRADMAPAMDATDVQASETRYLTATFHFIRI